MERVLRPSRGLHPRTPSGPTLTPPGAYIRPRWAALRPCFRLSAGGVPDGRYAGPRHPGISGHPALPRLNKPFTAAMVRKAIRALQEEHMPVNIWLGKTEALSNGENDV